MATQQLQDAFICIPDGVVGEICQFLKDPPSMAKASLISKRFFQIIMQQTKKLCVSWWRQNLKLASAENLHLIWPLENKIYPLLQYSNTWTWQKLWCCLSKQIDVWKAEDSCCFEKASYFIRIGRMAAVYPSEYWEGMYWSWYGPYIKIDRVQVGERFQYQLLTADHATDEEVLKESKGVAVLENGVTIKGSFLSGTMGMDDDLVEYFYLCRPDTISSFNDPQAVTHVKDLTCCEQNPLVLLRCIGCRTQFCLFCQKDHSVDNCDSEDKYHWSESWSHYVPKCAGWKIIYRESSDESFVCKSRSPHATRVGSIQYPSSYYDPDSLEAQELDN